MPRFRYRPVWASVSAPCAYRDGFRAGIADAFGASVVSRSPYLPRFRSFAGPDVLATLRDDASRVVEMPDGG